MLVELVGWDLGRATVAEMDGFDGWFVCGGCRASGGEGEGRKALTWRECVCFSTLLFGRGVLIEIQVLHYMDKESEPPNTLPPLLEPLNERSKSGRGEKGRVRSLYQR